MVPISKYIRTKLNFPASNFLPIIHNGVDEDKIKFVAKPDDYFSWAGRIIPSKGLHIALNLSEKLDIKLKIAGPHGQFSDSIDSEEYFTQIIERINQNPNTEYLGALPHEELCDLMAHSKGLIFPTDGNETFPMIVLEAMMGGTPVITLNKGPLPESITDQENGFLCENEEEMAKAITQIDTIERGKCRLRAEKDFSLEVMSRKYESAFKEVLNSRT